MRWAFCGVHLLEVCCQMRDGLHHKVLDYTFYHHHCSNPGDHDWSKDFCVDQWRQCHICIVYSLTSLHQNVRTWGQVSTNSTVGKSLQHIGLWQCLIHRYSLQSASLLWITTERTQDETCKWWIHASRSVSFIKQLNLSSKIQFFFTQFMKHVTMCQSQLWKKWQYSLCSPCISQEQDQAPNFIYCMVSNAIWDWGEAIPGRSRCSSNLRRPIPFAIVSGLGRVCPAYSVNFTKIADLGCLAISRVEVVTRVIVFSLLSWLFDASCLWYSSL